MRNVAASFALIFVAALSRTALATTEPSAEEATSRSDASPIAEAAQKGPRTNWAIEGMVQAHSVAATSSPWAGIAASYRASERLAVGVRGFVPVAATVDKSSYGIEAFARGFSSTRGDLSFFVEPSAAVNFYEFQPFASLGLAVGGLERLAPILSVGVSGGIEAARYVVDSVGIEQESNYVIYPKVALISEFRF